MRAIPRGSAAWRTPRGVTFRARYSLGPSFVGSPLVAAPPHYYRKNLHRRFLSPASTSVGGGGRKNSSYTPVPSAYASARWRTSARERCLGRTKLQLRPKVPRHSAVPHTPTICVIPDLIRNLQQNKQYRRNRSRVGAVPPSLLWSFVRQWMRVVFCFFRIWCERSDERFTCTGSR